MTLTTGSVGLITEHVLKWLSSPMVFYLTSELAMLKAFSRQVLIPILLSPHINRTSSLLLR